MKQLGDIIGQARTYYHVTEMAEPAPARSSRYACDICKDIGFLRLSVTPDHPDFGKGLTRPCQCKVKEIIAKRKVKFFSEDMAIYAESTLDNYVVGVNGKPQPQLIAALDAARSYSQGFEGWLVVHGPVGGGKTHLAVAIAKEALDAGKDVQFVKATEVLNRLRATFAKASDVDYQTEFDLFKNAEVLVLDDLGAGRENETDWGTGELYKILEARYTAQRSTVITTNLKPGSFGARLNSRLGDSQVVKLVCLDSVRDFRPHKLVLVKGKKSAQ